jgi:uncharacterized phage protein (TIGR02218 family)
MKSISPDLQAHLNSGTTTLCWCWKITRNDSTTLGFTDHDGAVTFDGTIYEAVSGFTATEVQSTLGLAVDNLTVLGALSADAITEADLAAGLYDNASIEIWRVNWTAPDQRVLMRKGNLGEVKRGKTAFQAEVRGLAHLLNQPVGRAYGYSCDADLGDMRCTIDLSNPLYRGAGTVAAITDQRRLTASGLDGFADQWFSGGKLTWTSGANANRAMEVNAMAWWARASVSKYGSR